MNDGTVAILWDASHLWGLMAHRAMSALGVPHSFIMAQEIAQGALFRKRPAILLVPGGSARQKALALGVKGIAAVQEWTSVGGFYLGFCGGAGLALSTGAEDGQGSDAGQIHGLGLCPWHRKVFRDRIYHLISGHVLARTTEGPMSLPVWWPGRFEEGDGAVDVLARYEAPGADLWLADLPLASVPMDILRQWHDLGRVDASQVIKTGQPLVISGDYGQGGYVLSYAHLETPDSPEANGWLARIIAQKSCLRPQSASIPPWRIPGKGACEGWGHAGRSKSHLDVWLKIMALGHELGFFFERSPWLQGWRRGAPGMGCNHLLACLDALCHLRSGPEEQTGENSGNGDADGELEALFANFCREAEISLWDLRLTSTLEEKNTSETLEAARNRLFGHPMLGGGMIECLLALLEKLIYRYQHNLTWNYGN